ncbi:MAG: hypothetical protein ACHQKZ_00295 [Solirubrobacterales bacterium]|jgi:hypothetical protein
MGRLGRTGVFLLLLATYGSPSAAQVRGESERWLFSGTLRQTFTDNLFLIGLDGAPGESISGATLALSYSRARQRTSFSAMGWVNGSVYYNFPSYNGLSFGFGLSGQAGLDRRARVRYSLSFSNGLNLEALYSNRVGLPQLDVKSLSGSTGFAYNITPDTVGTLSFDGSGLRYRTEIRTSSNELPADLLAPPNVLAPLQPGGDGDTDLPTNDGSVQVLRDLAREGLVVEALDYWSWRAGAGITHTFSEETAVHADFNYSRSYSDSGSGIVPDGELLSASTGLSQALDPTVNLNLSYTFQEARYGLGSHTHSVVGRVAKVFGKKVRGDLSLGASYFDGPTVESSAWDLIGGASLSVQMKRTSLALQYDHVRYQGVITGRSQISDDAFLSLGHTFSKKVFGTVHGLYRNTRDEFIYSYDEIRGGASIGYRLAQRWNLSASYGYSHYDQGVLSGASRNSLSLSLGYSKAMKP